MSTRQGQRRPTTMRTGRRVTRQAVASIRAGGVSGDRMFDGFLPEALNEVSARYWTPVPVVRRVVSWLRNERVRTVVDLGSGAGKFCVAGALLSRCTFVGLEQRASLVSAAQQLAETFDVAHRVAFVHGRVGSGSMPVSDAYYIFNPFGAYEIHSEPFAEPELEFTPERHAEDTAAITSWLLTVPAGTVIVTYNGLGTTFPRGYVQLDVVRGLPGTLRLWKKVHADIHAPASSLRRLHLSPAS